ncbi:preprotein translocase subunit SecG [Psittacicella hinzii]|uniref:Protein-export membrane protein SecG n=1 Tax=Psittacicella hinzii TaxID=2028575 RepID=A0A3A1YLE0_9GAMM|nr:preprotein translocase subunit SecG [Psittacicella hinzii]RIY37820.1 preprotein translocase subunit SecG [Psittacicella hinzii]
MYILLLIIYVLVAVFLITLIMLQQGKGADAGALGGSGASNTVFGSSGSATFLSRLTAIFATIFMIGALVIANINVHRTPAGSGDDLLKRIGETPAQTQPATTPATPTLPTDNPTTPTVPSEPSVPTDDKK